MSLLSLSLLFITGITLGYFFYGSFLSKIFGLNAKNLTPAHTENDGKEFVPTKPFYLFCQHFSAIAASGPIAGPILACQRWGWLPCLVWISIGVVLIGAVHDFSALAASVRHKGVSVATIVKEQMGKKAGLAFLAFIWLALIYIIVAFSEVTAASFVSTSEELETLNVSFNKGGAVASASVFYLLLCLIYGFINRFTKIPLWLSTIFFVPAVFGVTWLGTYFSTLFLFDIKTFLIIIIVYCGLSSLSPVWLLLQPRGYLGGFVLFFVLAIGLIGLFFGNFEIKQPAILESHEALTSLFPFLFVTIACGACSGFHGLICGGTTAKQLDKESHAYPVGYGGMLAEALVAVIALSTVMIFTSSELKGLKPGSIYGMGIGEFLSFIIGPEYKTLAITFGAMAFSTFVFDTLDVSTRIGRYLIQELFGWKKEHTKYWETILTLTPPLLILLSGKGDSFIAFWTIFGTANQLLAALTLLGISLWLLQSKKSIYITFIPMCFLLTVTLIALSDIALESLFNGPQSLGFMNGVVAVLLLLFAVYIIYQGLSRLVDILNTRTDIGSLAKEDQET